MKKPETASGPPDKYTRKMPCFVYKNNSYGPFLIQNSDRTDTQKSPDLACRLLKVAIQSNQGNSIAGRVSYLMEAAATPG